MKEKIRILKFSIEEIEIPKIFRLKGEKDGR